MNTRILIPRRNRRNPGWLKRLARWVGQLRRQFGLYRLYRACRCTHAEAWDKAGRTL
jgi:hypothetical protein